MSKFTDGYFEVSVFTVFIFVVVLDIIIANLRLEPQFETVPF